MTNIIFTDAETSVKCPVGSHKAHPLWLGNKVVMYGYKLNDGTPAWIKTDDKYREFFTSDDLLVGHNLKFDVSYYCRHDKYAPLPNMWCTQLAEYIITGQRSKMSSLNDLIIKYFGSGFVKDDRIAAYWKDGKDTEDIPKSLLTDYLTNDVEVLEPIFNSQIKLAKEQGQLPLIIAMMDSLRATTSMYLHGMRVDYSYVGSQFVHYSKLSEDIKKHIVEKYNVDPASNKQLSLYFFGGEEKSQEKQLVGKYKNGKDKYKLVDIVINHPCKFPKTKRLLTVGKNGYYSVNDETLDLLIEEDRVLPSLIRDYRISYKVASTYYAGIIDNLMPSLHVHPNISHTNTSTGRLSSNSPNLQNQTDVGDIKKAFISRYIDGCILELDYSQLEVVWLAYLSNDKQLISDINGGVDIHTALFQDMYHRTPTKEERKAFKPRTFQLIYGAGAKAIAEQGKIPLSEARQFVDVFYTRYKGVKKWHAELLAKAEAEKQVYYTKEEPGPFYRYLNKMPWGRIYHHEAYIVEWSSERRLSPTELKNYPVQGSATGDMVPLMLGVLFRKLEQTTWYKEKKVCLIMTVHDSIVLDVQTDIMYDVAMFCKNILEDAPTYLKEMLSIDFPCRLKVGVEAGPNWQEKEEIA